MPPLRPSQAIPKHVNAAELEQEDRLETLPEALHLLQHDAPPAGQVPSLMRRRQLRFSLQS